MTKLREMAREVPHWVPVSVDERYEICRGGVVRHKRTQRPLKPWIGTTGYPCVSLGVAKNKKNYSIHRLVALAFIPNPGALDQINHKDGDKANFKLSNLEWCSRGQNMVHAWRTGLFRPQRHSGEDAHQAKLTDEKVVAILKMLKARVSKAEIARQMEVSESSIRFIANGTSWKHIPR